MNEIIFFVPFKVHVGRHNARRAVTSIFLTIEPSSLSTRSTTPSHPYNDAYVELRPNSYVGLDGDLINEMKASAEQKRKREAGKQYPKFKK